MNHRSPPQLSVLHGLRVKGFASPAALAVFTGLDEAQVADLLVALAAPGMVVHREGPVTGWRLTDAGRLEHTAALAADMDESGARAQVRAGFDRFLALDETVKALCTAWQVRDLDAGVVNDHTDPSYDAAVVARLAALHPDALATVADLADALDRFGPYRARLTAAYDRLLAGDRDALTKPLTDSYHDVWMELHEDLLLTLGLERSASRLRTAT